MLHSGHSFSDKSPTASTDKMTNSPQMPGGMGSRGIDWPITTIVEKICWKSGVDSRAAVPTWTAGPLVLCMKTEAYYVNHPNFVCFLPRWCALGLKIFFLHGPFWVVCSIAVIYVVTQRNAMLPPTMPLWLRDDTNWTAVKQTTLLATVATPRSLKLYE